MSWPPLKDEEAWRELVAWRHSEVNLNHLQIALLQKNAVDWRVLWNEHFLREELYRDGNGTLVNHPLHLYEILEIYSTDETHEGKFPSVDHIRDELFYEEGLIDLTMSRLWRKPSRPSQGQSDMDTSPSTTGPGQSGTQDLPLVDTRSLRDIVVTIHKDVKIADHPQPISLQPYMKDGRRDLSTPGRQLVQVVDKLCGPKGQLSTAELLSTIIENLAEFTNAGDPIYYLSFASVPEEYRRDVLILQCQIAGAFEEHGLSFYDHLALSFSNSKCLDDVMEGVRFLSRPCVREVLREYLQLHRQRPDVLLQLVLEDRLWNWTLQDLCVMEIMQDTEGDVRRVWYVDGLPDHVKELFHIPFLKRVDELERRHEEHMARQQGWFPLYLTPCTLFPQARWMCIPHTCFDSLCTERRDSDQPAL